MLPQLSRFTTMLEKAGAKYTLEVMTEFTQVSYSDFAPKYRGAIQYDSRAGCKIACHFCFRHACCPPPLRSQDPVTAVTEDICMLAKRLDASALVMTAHK